MLLTGEIAPSVSGTPKRRHQGAHVQQYRYYAVQAGHRHDRWWTSCHCLLCQAHRCQRLGRL